MGEHVWVARASGVFILGFELTFPVVIFVRWTRVCTPLAAVFLHVTTWLLLGLDYWAWAITVPLVLIDWPAACRRRCQAWRRPVAAGATTRRSAVRGGRPRVGARA